MYTCNSLQDLNWGAILLANDPLSSLPYPWSPTGSQQFAYNNFGCYATANKYMYMCIFLCVHVYALSIACMWVSMHMCACMFLYRICVCVSAIILVYAQIMPTHTCTLTFSNQSCDRVLLPNNILHLAPCSAVNTNVHSRQGGLSMYLLYVLCISSLFPHFSA